VVSEVCHKNCTVEKTSYKGKKSNGMDLFCSLQRFIYINKKTTRRIGMTNKPEDTPPVDPPGKPDNPGKPEEPGKPDDVPPQRPAPGRRVG